MIGGSTDAITGKKHEEVIKLKRNESGIDLDKAEAGGWPLTSSATLYVEGDIERTGGSYVPVGITYAPLISPDGNILNLIATVRDISRFREAEEIKSTFISVSSHELKTPVALIKGYVATLRRDDVEWDRAIVDDSLAVIEEEADRLTNLIENLLDASRLQAGALKINRNDVDLSHLVKRICERFQTQSSRHTLQIDLPDHFPVILADEDRLAQVLTNLLSNAIRYSPEGGEIRKKGKHCVIRYVMAWVPMLIIAIANGALRQLTFGRVMSELHAHQLSTVIGSAWIGLFIYVVVRTWPPSSAKQSFGIGIIWVLLTVIFEFAFGRWGMHRTWDQLFSEYNLAAGRVWIVFLAWLAVAPYVFFKLRKAA